MTDLADCPPNFWIEPGQAQHLVCGSATGTSQACAMGSRDGQIHRVSGMILRPDFYVPAPLDRRARRRQPGLDADATTAVVMFGDRGSTMMLRIATQLHDVPLILMYGHNAGLANTLRALPAAAPGSLSNTRPTWRTACGSATS